MSANIYNTLGLAMRARKIVTGDAIINDIKSRRVYLVIIAEDASDNTKKKYINKCQYYHVDYRIFGDSASLSHAIGKHNRVVLGISDQGFATNISKKLGG